jgi:hypothetical protein
VDAYPALGGSKPGSTAVERFKWKGVQKRPPASLIRREGRREGRQSARNGNVPRRSRANPASPFAFALRGLIAGKRRAS